MINRIIIVILDSVGMGELPDAHYYGDEGSNTIGNIIKKRGFLSIPNLQKLGIANIDGFEGLKSAENPAGNFGRMREVSAGKDTTTGHWEIAGLILDKPFPTYPQAFPAEVIDEFIKRTGTDVLGNVVASGTEIIKSLGEEHMKTGFPIVYTSADSVFQIAAHEEVIPIERLYEMCETAREILTGEHAVGRVIARPFAGQPGDFTRTDRRKDFSLKPSGVTMLDLAVGKGLEVWAVGKIQDIYAGRGITRAVHIHDNMDGVDKTLEFMNSRFKGILFTNLVDFDMKYGHRNDWEGYARALESFDSRMPEIMEKMKDDDLLFISADHGCDPTTVSTDHSREYVPLLVYGRQIKRGVNLGTRECFCDVAQTVADFLGLGVMKNGRSFKELIE